MSATATARTRITGHWENAIQALRAARRTLSIWAAAFAGLITLYAVIWPSVRGNASWRNLFDTLPQTYRALFTARLHAMNDSARTPEHSVTPPAIRGDNTGGRRARLVEMLDPVEDLNFRHFRMRHMAAKLLRPGLPPGCQAPDFELPDTDGNRLRLSDLRGKPVLLHFVSYTCPVTRGGVATMAEICRLYGEQVRIIEVLVRQAHPGERHGAYRSDEAKLDDGRAYQREERIPWPVLIDDLAGTVQRAYGGLAATVYLIDSRGLVSFCGVWGQSPALRVAIDDLLARDGTGSPAGKGTDRRPHLAAAIVAGQRGPVRGGRQALVDLELGFPGASILMITGRLARPLLAPLALRTAPLPARARAGLVIGVLGAATAIGLRLRHRPHDGPD